jgi:hypothetical protein
MRSLRRLALATVVTLAGSVAASAAPYPIAFGTVAVGSSATVPCFSLCFGSSPGNCNGSGTENLTDGAAAPFSIQNLRVHTGPINSAADCTGTAASFPVTLAVNQSLVMDFKFAPTQGGSFSDLVQISGFQIQLTGSAPGGSNACVPTATTLCIDDQTGDKRYEIRVHYSSPDRNLSGDGSAVPLASLGITQGGTFAFFGTTNPEMLIKVLPGCSVNQKHWVFLAAVTDVGYTVTVRDTTTGAVRIYSNTDHHAASPVQDTSAFSC